MKRAWSILCPTRKDPFRSFLACVKEENPVGVVFRDPACNNTKNDSVVGCASYDEWFRGHLAIDRAISIVGCPRPFSARLVVPFDVEHTHHHEARVPFDQGGAVLLLLFFQGAKLLL